MSFEVGVAHKRQPHLLADLAELLLVAGYDGLEELSQARLEQLVKEIPVAAEELEAEEAQDGQHAVEQHESFDRHIEDCWGQLEYRASVFSEYYPFEVNGPLLSWKAGMRTPRQCLYVFLLVCSRLRSFKGITGFAQRAARVFTLISKMALETLSAATAIVRIFDANSDDRRNHYGTNLRHAMKALALELGAHHVFEDEIGRLPTSGDHGLDLVSIRQFSDGAKGSVAVFGQCGAQELEWPSKTLEAHPIAYRGLFSCLHEPSNMMFIPVSYRDTSGAWVENYKTSGCLLVDRLRIVRLLEERWADAEPEVEGRCYPVLREVAHVIA
jgi:hypothetical protein